MIKTIQLTPLTLSDLIEGCIDGNGYCQRMLYDQYVPTMFGICLRYAKDYHQAEDMVQEGFIKVFNKIDQYRHEGSFEGWMKRIFINTSIEALRKKNRLFELMPNDQSAATLTDEDIISDLAMQDLLKCIQQLPNGYRTIFNLYVIEGFSHQEIGEMLGISEGTSKSQLSRARTTLQKIILQQNSYAT